MGANTKEADRILAEAQAFMLGKKEATWQDYNLFKSKLQDAGCFGYEAKLADIFNK